jgi:hypothetical protein
MDGNPAGFIEVVIRNLVRIVDFLPSGYGVGLVVMFVNGQSRRLGDFAAGTFVVRERADVPLSTLVNPSVVSSAGTVGAAPLDETVDEQLLLRFVHIRRLTPQDDELIREVLQRHRSSSVSENTALRLAESIAAKLEVDPPRYLGAIQFLQDVRRAYRQI